MMIFIYRDSWYDLELNIFPTDVTNHYSGYPITTQGKSISQKRFLWSQINQKVFFDRCGAEIWTVFGDNGKSKYQCSGTVFRLKGILIVSTVQFLIFFFVQFLFTFVPLIGFKNVQKAEGHAFQRDRFQGFFSVLLVSN